jgi:hypothetical protein
VLGVTLMATGCATWGAPRPRPCPAGLGGTFVQLGQDQLDLSDQDWRREVALLAATGVQTVVVQFTGDQQGAFDRRYPQRPVRTLARTASDAGMDVWLGLHADPRWPHKFDLEHALPPPLDDRQQAQALAALCRDTPRCRGFYLSPELDDAGGPGAVPRMTRFLARTTAALRALAPDHRIAMAPYFSGTLSPAQHAELWRPMLPLVDVFMLQDRVGSGVGNPQIARRYLESLRPVLPPATELWSVVELFDQQAGPPRDQGAFRARPARWSVIARSLSEEGAAADRLIAFSVLDYMDPRRGGDAARLHTDYRAWCDGAGPSNQGRKP